MLLYSFLKKEYFFQRIYTFFYRLASTKNVLYVENTKWEFETGRFALHSDSSATARFGDTTVLSTVTTSNHIFSEKIYSLPFTSDYTEKSFEYDKRDNTQAYYLRNRFNRDRLILISRAIDRSVRPLFPYGLNKLCHLESTLIANDNTHDPVIASINSSSLALSLSSIPWNGPIGAVRVGLVDNSIIINPDKYLLEQSSANYIISCSKEGICMIEGYSIELSNKLFTSMLELAFKRSLAIIETIIDLQNIKGYEKDFSFITLHDNEIIYSIRKSFSSQIKDVLFDETLSKPERSTELSNLAAILATYLNDNYPEHDKIMLLLCKEFLFRDIMIKHLLEQNIRPDGRNSDNLRPIKCFTDVFKPLNGSSLFQRGETQILSSVKFSCPNFSYSSSQNCNETESFISKNTNFSLKYSSPSFATRNIELNKWINRREIGHGMLTENAFYHILPDQLQYNTQILCEVHASNGSTSMSSICGASLALFDSGFPLKTPVVGVTCGLISEFTLDRQITNYSILVDLQGIEDALGNMDFKIGGTCNGITACQLDIKMKNGIPLPILYKALQTNYLSRLRILDRMNFLELFHNPKLKYNTPSSMKMYIAPEKKWKILGNGKLKLQYLLDKTSGKVKLIGNNFLYIFAHNRFDLQYLSSAIDALLLEEDEIELEFGNLYRSRIVEIKSFGLMVKLYPSQVIPNFVHINQLHPLRADSIDNFNFKVDDYITLKYFGRDPFTNYLRFSRKAMMFSNDNQPNRHFHDLEINNIEIENKIRTYTDI